MATATEVIGHLAARGITLEADGTSGLRVNGISRLTDYEKAALKAHKGAILKALAVRPNPTTTATNAPVASSTAVTEPPARECRNCAHFEKYPYEPLGSCHSRRKMQHATSKPRQFGCSDFQPVTGREGRP